ncbi:MAG: helix-turn-helix domain-containing protein [Flavobacteriaceae bacterium]|jgi:transcriptional regulator with XRE-family HTH domain|nr:helix-turn-helix domain-containing protein [Flavobacteriaceae bacterium]
MDNFVNRLTFLLEHFEFSASNFADKIGVQRSSLSHILSGRNKPSLDFILKIKECFPMLSFDWLLQGKGTFIEGEITPISTSQNIEKSTSILAKEESNNIPLPNTPFNLFSETEETTLTSNHTIQTEAQQLPPNQSLFLTDNNLERIILFYKDGTFKQYISR